MKAKLLAATLSLAAMVVPAAADTVFDWRWLAGTTWYVPTSGLPAYVYMAPLNRLVPVQDQTVYTITGYRNGYFWGRTGTRIGTNPVTCKALVGSVTPEGSLYLTFTNYPFTPGATPTVGIGNMVLKQSQWTMANQMSTGSSISQVGHWAYMVQTRPGTASWSSLPGVGMSVPEFMAPCQQAAPKTPG